MDKLVSVIVPCYNGEQFVDRCFTSIFDQNYSNIEIIAVNDGSTDQSEKAILAWKSKSDYEHIRNLIYIYQDNKGPGGAINTGLKYVHGDYLMLLDVDDEYLPDAISSKVLFLNDNPEINVVRSNGWRVQPNLKKLFISDDAEKNINDLFLALIEGKTNNWAGSYMIRTSALFDFYPKREIYESRYGQNLQILLPLAYKNKCGYIDIPQMNYNIQTNSLSHTSESPKNGLEFAMRNWAGYRDIRLYMIAEIVKDPVEADRYNLIVESNYQRCVMSAAADVRNFKIAQKEFDALKKNDHITLDDLITYCRAIHPCFAFPFRLIRKLRNTFSMFRKAANEFDT